MIHASLAAIGESRFREAEELIRPVATIYEREDNSPMLAAALSELAGLRVLQGDARDAVLYLRRELLIRRSFETPNSVGIADATLRLAEVKLQLGEDESALQLTNAILNNIEDTHEENDPLILTVYERVANIYLSSGTNLPATKVVLEKLLRKVSQTRNELFAGTVIKLAMTHVALGDAQRAGKVLQDLQQVSDDVLERSCS